MATRNDNDQTKAADEAARTARTVTDEAARVGEQTARAGADLVNRGTETARDVPGPCRVPQATTQNPALPVAERDRLRLRVNARGHAAERSDESAAAPRLSGCQGVCP